MYVKGAVKRKPKVEQAGGLVKPPPRSRHFYCHQATPVSPWCSASSVVRYRSVLATKSWKCREIVNRPTPVDLTWPLLRTYACFPRHWATSQKLFFPVYFATACGWPRMDSTEHSETGGVSATDPTVDEFATYEDFLDSQIRPIDLFYLEVLKPFAVQYLC